MSTIVALATAPLNCAIHIIRISGSDTFEILQKVCKKPIKRQAYTIQRNFIVDNNKIIDDVLLNVFVSPKSFTGEDSVEINCHGGVFLATKIINLLIKKGCEQAKNGEFSQRAMLNKKICYSQAESINNLINSSNNIATDVSINGVLNKSIKEINQIRDDLFQIVGSIEVNIDYPEYNDVPEITNDIAISKLNSILNKINIISNNTRIILPIIEGVKVAIIGSPNVGKSSLLNLLANENKAIVSDIKGTTRDVVEAKVNINSITYTFFDTAGMHQTNDQLELLGISKTYEAISKSDVIIWLLEPNESIDVKLEKKLKQFNSIKVFNKSDIKKVENQINISVKNDDIEDLLIELEKQIKISDINLEDSTLLQSNRQMNLLNKIIDTISSSINDLKNGATLDLIIGSLEKCVILFNNIVGISFEYDMLDELFSKFCIGK